MADEDKKKDAPAVAEETEEEEGAGDKVDFASLIDEDEPETADAATDDAATPTPSSLRVDLDGDNSGWVDDGDEEESEEEDSYEDTPADY